MTDMTPPPIPPIGAVELPDPRGPINDDFKRGVCYTALLVAHPPVMPEGTIITITLPNGGKIECRKVPEK